MFDIVSVIPGKKRTTATGWISFNAVCCHHRGHRPDRKGRAGIRKEGNNWTYHCFNCNFKAIFVLGRTINGNTKKLLQWCGIDESQINKWSLESLQKKDILELVMQASKPHRKITFAETDLPQAELLDENNPNHKIYVDYIRKKRGLNPSDYPYMVTPYADGRNAKSIIIPYTFKNKIVGYSYRYLDDAFPKYLKVQQNGYVFGYDFQKPNWQYCIVVEGLFDALAINGCALTHNTISDEQAELLYKLNRTIIVVPDYDKTGLDIIDRALDLGFQVSMPDWEPDVKDTNDAVKKYGKVATLLSIIQNATSSKIKIELMRKKIAKRISD